MFKPFAFLTLLCLPIAALATPVADPSLLALQQMDQRVAAIGYRLARANADICERKMPLSGMLVHALDQYPAKARPAVAATFGIEADPAILLVVPGSPAARAGLQPGDGLIAVAGKPIPIANPKKKASYSRVQAVEETLLAALASGPVPIEYERGGERRLATIDPEQGCLSRVQLLPSGRVNAGADGTYAQLTTGIVEFAANDDELALVIAHEMAHNVRGHRSWLDQRKVSRGLLKSLDGSAGKIRKTEVEADYLALYFVERAGFRAEAAPGFWRRYGPGSLLEIFSDGTHPGRASRVSAAEQTIREIRSKRQANLPLTPVLTGN